MSKTAFKEFIEKEKAIDAENRSFDWEGKKQAYLRYLDKFFADVEKYLHEYITSKTLRIEKNVTTIEEEYIDKYEVPTWRIYLYSKHVDLVPVGTNIVGSPGRVDLRGVIKSVRFILADKKEKSPQVFVGISWAPIDKKQMQKNGEEWIRRKRDYVWKIITDPPDIRFLDFNEDRFLSLLQEVLDG